MYNLEWSTRSLADLGRLQSFLHSKSPRAAAAAIDAILVASTELREFPSIGRPLSVDAVEFRELRVPFSNSGYLVLYRFDGRTVEIQAIKHMREDQY